MQSLYKTALKVFVGISVVGLYSCNKGKDPVKQSDAEQDTVVYISGNEAAGSSTNAVYWRNGVPVRLTKSGGAVTSSIFVSGKDVYVAGSLWKGSNSAAVYWKNGKLVELTDGTEHYNATSIFVVGNDVYVAGNHRVNSYVTNGVYWKNGEKITLTNETINSWASDIYVSDGDVYVAGGENEPFKSSNATYWKNGVAVRVSISSSLSDLYLNPFVRKIIVSGQDVYLAGRVDRYAGDNGYYAVATYWKNGQAVPLAGVSGDTEATTISVSNNDVYVGGYHSRVRIYNSELTAIMVWKNGTVIYESDSTGRIDTDNIDMYALGSNVYVAGAKYYTQCRSGVLWKNGMETRLNELDKCAVATSVFVTP